ncbi:molybdopterin-dependent oxidoreductase [Candidatus Mancarchaeum acidiphilum]|uniref:molybdopterin-dependent oxidoreductase n=1 Tax=Candidatus Mancarchaeum acidiphilum TaxID=1920749 RepID=UPI0022B7E318|nr:molybdopterin-dependent oxidoreductase [Candidatus Mancarchaeum acidiphilum]
MDIKTYKLRIYGSVENELSFTWEQLMGLPMSRVKVDIHCVTRWSRLGDIWEGIKLKYLLDMVKPKGNFLMLRSSYVGYSANVPMSYINEDCMVAFKFNNLPLEKEHGGPVRAFIPTLYFWKSTKWLDEIEVMDEDKAGFWEKRGYNMRGDYNKEERYWDGLNFVNKLVFFGNKDKDDE